MSQENVEIVRRGLAEFTATQELPDSLAADYFWDMSTFRGWPDKQWYEGQEEFMEFFNTWTAPFEDWSQEIERAESLGCNEVLVVVRQYARPRGSGARVELQYGVIYTVEGGLIRGGRAYATPQEALEAAGVSE